jgi:hypothetical protein
LSIIIRAAGMNVSFGPQREIFVAFFADSRIGFGMREKDAANK